MSEAEEKIRRTPLVAALIGLLLLLWGLAAPETFRVLLHYTPLGQLTENFLLQNIVDNSIVSYLLVISGIAMGIGLLHFAPLAHRGAVVLLLYSLVISILLPVFMSIFDPGTAGEHGVLLTLLGHKYIYDFLRAALLLLFLDSLEVRRQWEEQTRPGLLTEIAENLKRRLPGNMSTMLALIALLLCCCPLNNLFGLLLPDNYGVLRQPTYVAAWPIWLMLAHDHNFYYFLGYLLAGVSLLWRQERACMPAIAILTAIFCYLISVDIHFATQNLNQLQYHSQPNAIPIWVIGVIRTLLNLSISAGIIFFLAHAGKEVARNTAERRLSRANVEDSDAD